ncbi:hypothetical protein CP09DC79_1190A, partial [Chlamydia psittaci 09DC79]
MNRSKP